MLNVILFIFLLFFMLLSVFLAHRCSVSRDKNKILITETNTNLFMACPGPYTPLNKKEEVEETPTHIQMQLLPQTETTQPLQRPEISINERDYRVLNDPLYPPVNRNAYQNEQRFLREPRLQQDIQSDDKYRIIGYLVNSHDKEDVWKLFARELNIRRGSAVFYAANADKNKDIKIVLSQDIIIKGHLKDIYNLSDEVIINHPMFMTSPYKVVSLPGNDSNYT